MIHIVENQSQAASAPDPRAKLRGLVAREALRAPHQLVVQCARVLGMCVDEDFLEVVSRTVPTAEDGSD